MKCKLTIKRSLTKRQPSVSQNDVITFMTSYLKDRFKSEGCLPSSNLKNDLALDSLDIAGIVLALEEKYGIEFVGDKMPLIETMENLAQHTIFMINKKNG